MGFLNRVKIGTKVAVANYRNAQHDRKATNRVKLKAEIQDLQERRSDQKLVQKRDKLKSKLSGQSGKKKKMSGPLSMEDLFK